MNFDYVSDAYNQDLKIQGVNQQLFCRLDAKRRRSDDHEAFILQFNKDKRTSPDKRKGERVLGNSASSTEHDTGGDSSQSIRKRERSTATNMKLVVQCRYPKCGKTAEPSEAKNTFKVCHNCDHVYCSRDCRREHWPKHRKLCLHSRIGELCRRVLVAIKQNEDVLLNASTMARKGFLSDGRGCVKFYFHTPQLAEYFATGNVSQSQPTYVKWTELVSSSDVASDLHLDLCTVCKTYNPETRLVILVAIHVVSEVPSNGGAVKWERQIICRYAKTKLSPDLMVKNLPLNQESYKQSSYQPETIILTSLPGVQKVTKKTRQINFTNIQRELRDRGVNLSNQFPDVYEKLCNYVESGEHFAATTIYPIDPGSGKTFMCVIMPDAEAFKLDFLIQNHSDAKMIDVASSNKTLSSSE